MASFPNDLRFQKPWRQYQQRVLNEMKNHLDDDCLHVVAAPGSGKTVLGLEVIRRLNKPTLVLAPTLTIRDQWVDRLHQLFLPSHDRPPGWISRDLKNPGLLTATTYQALHRAYSGMAPEPEEELEEVDDSPTETPDQKDAVPPFDLIRALRDAGIRVVVVDEAHHLRTEWWKSLTTVVGSLDHPTVVALTATPPYDVPAYEWERYEQLCGPIDAEISVPELIATGDLCPHQDFVHFTFPSPEEARSLSEFRLNVRQFQEEIVNHQGFIAAVDAHPWLQRPNEHLEEILAEAAYFSSLLVFLNHVGRSVPGELRRILGLRKGAALPALDLEWLEILLSGCVFSDRENYAAHEEVVRDLEQRLRRLGAVERRGVTLQFPRRISTLLSTSIRKLDSIVSIVRLEAGALGPALRAVILTDYIRKRELPVDPSDLRPLQELGVVPIFEGLRRAGIEGIRLGILSGSLVVIPASAVDASRNLAAVEGLRPDQLHCQPLRYDPAFYSVQILGSEVRETVRLVTRLFARGELTVVVGTKALLGEGWDAPSINTLVLASFVGSYMLSNQMRGRAIRTEADNPDKTANIWHLVCVEPNWVPGDDFLTLTRRFRAFVGPSHTENRIENGFVRLGVPEPPFTAKQIGSINETMGRRALERSKLRERWQTALLGGVRLAEGVETPSVNLPRDLVLANTIAALFWQGIFLGGYFILSQLQYGLPGTKWEDLLRFLAVVVVVGALVALPKCLKALWLLLKHGRIEGSLQQVGVALLRTLQYMGALAGHPQNLQVRTQPGEWGKAICWLEGADPYESSVFSCALQQLLGPVENPRYLLVRRSRLVPWLRRDYHAVPDVIGRKKDQAEYFHKVWKKLVGPAELVHARTLEGRKVLLQARAHSLAAAFQKRSERVSRWK